MTKAIPDFWKSSLSDIETVIGKMSMGKSSVISYSAGSRPIYLIEYGVKQDLGRKANYNSACGAMDLSHYASKSSDSKPIFFFIGDIHGGEFEGIVAILNLVNILENGEDLRGKKWDYIYENRNNIRLIMIPCANPDGRARIPFDSFVGKSIEDLAALFIG